MKKILPMMAMLLLVAMLFGAIGCNTVEGAGKDIEAGGDAIQDAAD